MDKADSDRYSDKFSEKMLERMIAITEREILELQDTLRVHKASLIFLRRNN